VAASRPAAPVSNPSFSDMVDNGNQMADIGNDCTDESAAPALACP
jgi:hypothetical protein